MFILFLIFYFILILNKNFQKSNCFLFFIQLVMLFVVFACFHCLGLLLPLQILSKLKIIIFIKLKMYKNGKKNLQLLQTIINLSINVEGGLLEINIIGHCILLSETLIYLDLNFIWQGSIIVFKLNLENFASSKLGTNTQLYTSLCHPRIE